jgi:hypothetical protein
MGGLLILLGAGGLLSYGLAGRRRRRLVRYGRLLLAVTLGISAIVNVSALPASSGAGIAPASPALTFSTYLGGGGVDGGNSIAVDSAGNSYVVGFTDSINFPLANASQNSYGGGQQDVFVAKFNPAGGLLYSTYLGGDGQDSGTGIAVDVQGNAYITGFTTSANFPTRNALQPERRGPFDAFVAKLDPAGALAYSTYLGGSAGEHGSSVAVDSSGNIYVAGITQSHDFPLANAFQGLYGGTSDVYVARLNAAGTRLVYSTYLGGAGADGASSIAADAAGNLYVAGVTMSPNFPTADPLQTRLGGFFDSFVAKLNPAGARLIYSTYLGGSGEDRALRISVDNSGNAYVTGDTDSPNFPTVNAAQSASGGSSDAFVTKIDATGSALLYSTYLGGSGIDGGAAIAVDDAGHAYVTGFTASPDFPMAAAVQPMFGGGYDGFAARLNPTGGALDQSSYLGGNGTDSAFGVAAAPSGVVFVMGVTDSTNLPTASPFQPGNGGGVSDIFLAKIKQGPAITRAAIQGKHLIITGSGFEQGAVILLDGIEQKTIFKSGSSLKGKKAGQKITPGETVRLQVRNPDGTTSAEFRFTR